MDVMIPPTVSYQNVRLRRGAHRTPAEGACVMELVSMLSGERFTDRPPTACPVIGAFLRAYNDIVGDKHRQELLTCAASVVGTRRPELEPARVQRCVDAAVAGYGAQPGWRRRFDGDQRLVLLLALAEGPLDRAELDSFGYQLAKVLRGAPDDSARAVALVEDLVAIGTGPCLVVEPAGLRLVARR